MKKTDVKNKRVADSGKEKKVADGGKREKVADSGKEKKVADDGKRENVADGGKKKRVADSGKREKVADGGKEKKVADGGKNKRVVDDRKEKKVADSGKEKKAADDRKVIILTGGGSAGHVIPNLTLLPFLLADGWEVHYIGGKKGLESDLVPKDLVSYHEISTGKLRRYFDVKNFTDPFRVAGGVAQALRIISKAKPTVIFSKGGFVSVPVIMAGKARNVPCIIHESDITPGLANRMATPFAQKVCVSFKQTLKVVPKNKGVYTGAPIREELSSGDRETGVKLCGFSGEKPVLLITGGSLGSANINKLVRTTRLDLQERFDIVHVCGKGNLDKSLIGIDGYAQFEYVTDQLPHFYKIADIAVSRAGSGTIFEFLNLQIPALLIPISKAASRGDQILNAAAFEKAGYSKMLNEEEIVSEDVFVDAITDTYNCRQELIDNMKRDVVHDAKAEILNVIYSAHNSDR